MPLQKIKFSVCLALLITIVLLSGCAKSHKVRPEKINHSKTYRIGIIKVIGVMPTLFESGRQGKIEALNSIQYEEICKTIEISYNIKIDKKIKNNSPLFFIEYDERNIGRTYPYIGNDIYVQKSPIPIGSLFNYYKRENIDNNGFIDITYRFTFAELLYPLTGRFYYEVVVKDNNEEVIVHKDLIASIPTPKKGPRNLFADFDGMWEDVISCAEKIDEALLEDINEQK